MVGALGAGVHPYFTKGEIKAGSREGVPNVRATWRSLARCRHSHRCPGGPAGGAAPLRFPPPGAALTYLAPPQRRRRRDAVRVVVAPAVRRRVSV